MRLKTRLQEREKLDKFVVTYLRCFEPKDTHKMRRINNLGSLTRSIARGPLSLGIALTFPFGWLYSPWMDLALVYQLPFCGLAFVASRELLGRASMLYEYRFKRKLFEKYKQQMDLTRDEVEAIEFEEKLKLPPE